MTFIPETRCAL